DLAEAEVAVDAGDGRCLALDRDRRSRIHLARLHRPHVVRDADHAVGIVATTVRAHQERSDPGRITSRDAAGDEDVAGQLLERRDRDRRHGGFQVTRITRAPVILTRSAEAKRKRALGVPAAAQISGYFTRSWSTKVSSGVACARGGMPPMAKP